jgi:hypothetical protein
MVYLTHHLGTTKWGRWAMRNRGVIRTVIRSVTVTDIRSGGRLMSVQTPTLDQETADRRSADFHRCFAEFEARPDLFASDTFFDLLPPMWRFRLEGRS